MYLPGALSLAATSPIGFPAGAPAQHLKPPTTKTLLLSSRLLSSLKESMVHVKRPAGTV